MRDAPPRCEMYIYSLDCRGRSSLICEDAEATGHARSMSFMTIPIPVATHPFPIPVRVSVPIDGPLTVSIAYWIRRGRGSALDAHRYSLCIRPLDNVVVTTHCSRIPRFVFSLFVYSGVYYTSCNTWSRVRLLDYVALSLRTVRTRTGTFDSEARSAIAAHAGVGQGPVGPARAAYVQPRCDRDNPT